jgi:hypothetical protein
MGIAWKVMKNEPNGHVKTEMPCGYRLRKDPLFNDNLHYVKWIIGNRLPVPSLPKRKSRATLGPGFTIES